MASPYAYLLLSLVLFGVWLVLAAVRRDLRREMVRVSVGTMFLGLTEPLFVPEYWNPPTLGDLARRTGFGLESLLFSFAVGGIVFAAYHVLFGEAPSESLAHERGHPRHRYHALSILLAPVGFVVLLVLTILNPIYAAAIALAGGVLATLYCRPGSSGSDRARRYLGAYLTALGGAQAVVFTGGMGEHAAENCARSCAGMDWCGLRLDPARDAAAVGAEGCIGPPDATLKVHVITAGEEPVIARETASWMAHGQNALGE